MSFAPHIKGLASAFWLGSVLLVFGQGNIVYFQPATPIACYRNPNSPLPPLDFDVNQDGTPDFWINRNYSFFGVSANPYGNNRIAGQPAGPMDIGSYLFPFSAGQVIGSSLDPVATWYSLQSPNSYSEALITSSTDAGIGGLFANTLGYFGMEFQIQGQTHYGWALLDTTQISAFSGGGEILSWAYNANPDESIVVGAVPEPSTWALFMTGCAALVLYRFRRTRTHTK